MKAQLLSLALAGQLAFAADYKAPIEIFDALAPQASSTLSPAKRGASHPSLAAIPADVDAALNLPQLATSLAALPKMFPQMPVPAQVADIISGVQDVSLAFGKGSSESFADYATMVLWLADLERRAGYLEPKKLIAYNARSLELLKEATQHPLPTIYLSARVSDKLRPQLEELLAMITPVLQSPAASQAHNIMSKGAQLTQMKATKVGGIDGVELSFKILDKQINYTVLYQLKGNDLLLMGSQNPEQLPRSLAPEGSLLASPALQLASQQDVHLYLGEKNFISNIFRGFIGVEMERDSVRSNEGESPDALRQANRALLDAMIALSPEPTEGALNASLSLAGGKPLLQANWQNNQYQFKATPFKGINLLGPDPELEYVEMSELSQHPSLTPLQQAFDTMFQLNNEGDESKRISANLQLGELLTGHVYTLTKKYDFFSYFGVTDATKAKELLIKIEDNSYNFYHEQEEKPLKGKLPSDTVMGAGFFTMSDNEQLRQQALNCPEGASYSGALFKVNLRGTKPFKNVYGRLDKKSDTITLKVQLR